MSSQYRCTPMGLGVEPSRLDGLSSPLPFLTLHLPELPHLCGVHSSRSKLCLVWVVHRTQGMWSLIFPQWAVQGSCLCYEVRETPEKKGQEARPAAMDSLLGLSPTTSDQISPQCSRNLSFLPVDPIMTLSADKPRETGAGDQQEEAAAPLALSIVTYSRPGATYHPKHSVSPQVTFLKLVNLSLSKLWILPCFIVRFNFWVTCYVPGTIYIPSHLIITNTLWVLIFTLPPPILQMI